MQHVQNNNYCTTRDILALKIDSFDLNKMSLLKRILNREQLDALQSSAWYKRRVNYKIPITHTDIKNIFHALENSMDNWTDELFDHIFLSDEKGWQLWLNDKVYHWWISCDYPQHLINIKKYQNNKNIINQLNALIFIYQSRNNNTDILNKTVYRLLSNNKKLNSEIKSQSKAINKKWEYCQSKSYNGAIQLLMDNIPKSLHQYNKSLVELKLNRNSHLITQWLYEHNLCLKNDKFYW